MDRVRCRDADVLSLPTAVDILRVGAIRKQNRTVGTDVRRWVRESLVVRVLEPRCCSRRVQVHLR